MNNTSALVLVADNDPAVQRLLALVLGGLGLEVAVASDGAEAVRLVDQLRPGAVVADLQLPIMDGGAFIRAMRERGTYPPTIIVSAWPEGRTVARELGATFVQKPFDAYYLGELLVDLASRSQS